jgi:hypothetical protein
MSMLKIAYLDVGEMDYDDFLSDFYEEYNKESLASADKLQILFE